MPSWMSQCRTDAPQCFVLWWIAKQESISKQTNENKSLSRVTEKHWWMHKEFEGMGSQGSA